MFYIIRLGKEDYLAHEESIGWYTTTNLLEASRVGDYWATEFSELFEEEMKTMGYFEVDGSEFKEMTIIEIKYEVLKEIPAKDFENKRKYSGIEPK